MTFRTKLDFTNRQAKQYEVTSMQLSGRTSFGLCYSALTSGLDSTTSGSSFEDVGVVSDFTGTTGTTTYTFPYPFMYDDVGELSAITTTNSGATQTVGPTWRGYNMFTTVDGFTGFSSYSAVTYTVKVMDMLDTGTFSGNVTSDVLVYSATSLDWTGDTIWNDVSGYTRTKGIIISNGANNGYVLTCNNSDGKAIWSPAFSSGTSLWSASTGTNSIVQANSGGLASGQLSVVAGSGNISHGNLSVIFGGYGHVMTAGSDIGAIFGGALHTISGGVDTSVIIGGVSNTVVCSQSGIFVGQGNNLSGGTDNWSAIIAGKDNILSASRSVMLGGQNMVGTTPDTVYVPNINIQSGKGISFGTGNTRTQVEIEIGDWDMDATGTITVTHGLSGTEWKTVRDINITIRNDGDTTYYNLDNMVISTLATNIDSTNFNLARDLAGNFDTTDFDSTTYNRGFISFWYVPD